MGKIGRGWWAGIGLFWFAGGGWAATQNPASAGATPADQSDQASASSASPSDHGSAYYHFMLARRYQELAGIHNRSDYVDQAISEYKKAMEADPDSLFLRVNLAELYSRVGRIGDATREAEAVLKVNPDQVDAHRLLANLYLHNLGESRPEKVAKESLEKAIEHFEALVRLDRSETDSYVVLGRLYKLENQPEKSEQAFKKALNADPNSKSAMNYLAQLYFDQGEYQQVIELLKKIPENEMDGATLGMLGLAYLQAHDFGRSVKAYEKAIALEPDNQDIRRSYADALMDSGKTAEARTQLQRILKVDPEDGNSHLRLAQLDRQEGRFDQAREELQRAKTLLPDNMEVPYQQVLLEDSVGNEDKAVELLQGLLKQLERPEGKYTAGEARDRAIFLERLGMIYRGQEKFSQALDTFKQIASLGKTQEPQAEALIIDTLRVSRQSDKALEEANTAVNKFPKERSLILLRASLLGERGQIQEAVQPLQALLTGSPTDREVYLSMAQIYSQAKQYAAAEESIQKAIGLSPNEEDQVYPRFVLGSI